MKLYHSCPDQPSDSLTTKAAKNTRKNENIHAQASLTKKDRPEVENTAAHHDRHVLDLYI